jgi:signal peptidase I
MASADATKQQGPRVVIEQVVIALILAFVFRAYVVEAFVIPTGSMATTLYGAHLRLDCPDCGWDYTANYQVSGGSTAVPDRAVVRDRTGRTIDQTLNLRCPNCSYRLPPEEATALPLYHGDRVLVLKQWYLLAGGPDRFDVVVFKNPNSLARGHDPRSDPVSTEPFQENYIKRLVGLPGETLAILGGDVYVARNVEHKSTDELEPTDFEIARKPDEVQKALWRVVYDDDYRPRGLDRDLRRGGMIEVDDPFVLPWRTGGGWTATPSGEGGGFAFRAADSASTGELPFDPAANERSFALTDYLAYDQSYDDAELTARSIGSRRSPGITFGRNFEFDGSVAGTPFLHRVADLRLRLVHERESGDGPLELRLGKRGDLFVARLTPGRVELLRNGDIIASAEGGGFSPIGQPQWIELENLDYRVTVRIDGEDILQTTPDQYRPDVDELFAEGRSGGRADAEGERPTVSLAASGHDARVTHLGLFRDVHYTARDQIRGGGFYPYGSVLDPIRLNGGEYFVLGDNPFLSGDARTWTEPVRLLYEDLSVDAGRVPERFLLGKAFFVYWPGGYRPAPKLPRLVPNFGDMRMIR